VIFTIRKGWHYSRPFRFALWWNRKVFTRKVVFANNCRYGLPGDDQADTNKLFGVGYLPGHQKDSARFGWRYLPGYKMEVLAYCYVEGKRIIESVALCEVGQLYRFKLNITATEYMFSVFDLAGGASNLIGQTIIAKRHSKKLQYGLWPYFGGNRPAPHYMTILLDKA
jgi:hypothetical protein